MAMVCQRSMRPLGKVQSVFYRKSCQQQALVMSVTGYAKNLPNGDVEVVVCGEAQNVDKLVAWLRLGPPTSRIGQVVSQAIALESYSTFSTS